MKFQPQPLLNGLALTSMLCLSFSCAKTSAPISETKIRNGSLVASRATGPDRVSTVGLIGFGPQGQYTCSSVIVEVNILATAAHCVPNGATLYAYFGTDTRTASQNNVIEVDAVKVNPLYYPGTGRTTGGLPDHDIAIVHLSQSIPRGYQPAPILPSDEALQVNDKVLLAGFGITQYGNDSGPLRSTAATYVGTDAIGRLQINDPESRGACSGDSGGPLFAKVAGTSYAAGVLSGGPIPCRGVNSYTSLALHQNFIEESIAELNDN